VDHEYLEKALNENTLAIGKVAATTIEIDEKLDRLIEEGHERLHLIQQQTDKIDELHEQVNRIHCPRAERKRFSFVIKYQMDTCCYPICFLGFYPTFYTTRAVSGPPDWAVAEQYVGGSEKFLKEKEWKWLRKQLKKQFRTRSKFFCTIFSVFCCCRRCGCIDGKCAGCKRPRDIPSSIERTLSRQVVGTLSEVTKQLKLDKRGVRMRVEVETPLQRRPETAESSEMEGQFRITIDWPAKLEP